MIPNASWIVLFIILPMHHQVGIVGVNLQRLLVQRVRLLELLLRVEDLGGQRVVLHTLGVLLYGFIEVGYHGVNLGIQSFGLNGVVFKKNPYLM